MLFYKILTSHALLLSTQISTVLNKSLTEKYYITSTPNNLANAYQFET